MQRLEAALRQRDPDAKVFFAPTSLRAGGFWLPELAKGIGEATAFVLLVAEKGLGAWQVIEYYEALDRRVKQQDFPVVLVLLDIANSPDAMSVHAPKYLSTHPGDRRLEPSATRRRAICCLECRFAADD